MELTYVWCPECGLNSFTKSGFTLDGRQRIKCKYCGSKTTIGVKRRGERIFKEEKLLPILKKNPLILSKEERYVMGVLIADGCFTQGHTLSYTVSDKDLPLIQLVRTVLEIPSPVKTYHRERNGKVYIEHQLRWRYKYSQPFWAQLGLFERKTGNERWMDYMNDAHFVRGFFDGDGCLHVSKKTSEVRLLFTSQSEDFLEALNAYLFKYAGVTKKNIYMIHKVRTPAVGLRYRKKESIQICQHIYKDSEGLRLERKFNKYMELKK